MGQIFNRVSLLPSPQAATLHEAFAKAVDQLPMSASDQEAVRELAGVRERLRQAKFNLGPGSLSAPVASQTPLDCLLQGRYQDAIKLVDQVRGSV